MNYCFTSNAPTGLRCQTTGINTCKLLCVGSETTCMSCTVEKFPLPPYVPSKRKCRTSTPTPTTQSPDNKFTQASRLATKFNDLTQKIGLLMETKVDAYGNVALLTPDRKSLIQTWIDSHHVIVVDHPTQLVETFDLNLHSVYDILHRLLDLTNSRIDFSQYTDPDIAKRANDLYKALTTEFPGQKILKYIGSNMMLENPPVIIQQSNWRCIIDNRFYTIHTSVENSPAVVIPAKTSMDIVAEIFKESKFIKT
jgi:hypothetical protein